MGAKTVGAHFVEMAKHFVGHRLGEEVEEDLVVLALPEALAGLGKGAHQAGREFAGEGFGNGGVALEFDQAAEFAGREVAAGKAGERDRRRRDGAPREGRRTRRAAPARRVRPRRRTRRR